MKHQPNRLPADARHGFGGGAIDRGKPLTFRLNGRSYEGFAGDTVLSALLAAGVDGAGYFNGEAIALDERFAPLVTPVRAADATPGLPMDRTPVLPGLELRTLGPVQDRLPLAGLAARLASLVTAPSRTLGHRLDEPRLFLGPWLERSSATTIEADTVIVGGGIAGMSAALAATEAGGTVLLVERRMALGGDARFFGTVGEEEAPEATIARLADRIAATPAITVLAATEAFGLAGSRIAAHQVRVVDGRLEGRVLALRGDRTVLATGTAERLPVFPGNRMPGVVGAVAAFHRAERHGVWAGRRALFAMPHSFGYRLALLAADAGVTVQRAADSRINPQSRFVDFCKASGITLASGQVPRAAESPRGRPAVLTVGFAVNMDEASGEGAPIETELLVAAGDWQPRLALWLMAGGGTAYDPRRHRLAAVGAVEGVALAGAVAGCRSSTACLASGVQAIAALRGDTAAPIDDPQVETIYESRDDPTPIAPWRPGRQGFLDGGASFTLRPPPQRDESAPPAAILYNLGLADVAAAVELRAIPAVDAGAIAEERCLGGGEIADSGWRVAASTEPMPVSPPWLNGRFGPRPQLVTLEAADGRTLDAGCLLYPRSDGADPLAAIGAVLGAAPDGATGALAVGNRAALAAAPALFARDTSGAVPVRMVERKKPGKSG